MRMVMHDCACAFCDFERKLAIAMENERGGIQKVIDDRFFSADALWTSAPDFSERMDIYATVDVEVYQMYWH